MRTRQARHRQARGRARILLLEAENAECSSTRPGSLEDISTNVARACFATTHWRIADDRLQIRFRESQGARRHRLDCAQPAGKAQRHVAPLHYEMDDALARL